MTWSSATQVDLDLFDVVRNVVGPLTFSFSYYKIMPQLRGPRRPRRSSAARSTPPPRRGAGAPANTLRVASFNVENLFPVGKANDGHVITQAEYDEQSTRSCTRSATGCASRT